MNKLVNLYSKVLLRPLYNHFTAGENITSLENKIVSLNNKNIFAIVDYVKEFSNNDKDIKETVEQYNMLSHTKIDKVAIKLSAFDFKQDVMDSVIYNLVNNYRERSVLIDAENVKFQDQIEQITDYYRQKYPRQIYKTYQMYRKDSLKKLEADLDKKNVNDPFKIKLVRGAYLNEDRGTGKLFSTKEETDKSYNKAIDMIFDYNNTIDNYNLYCMFCTHNTKSINKMLEHYKKYKYNNNSNDHFFHHASLYGFADKDMKRVLNEGMNVYKYLPYGKYEDAMPYLMRRIQENPKIMKYYLS